MVDKDENLENIKIGCFGDSNVGKTLLTKKYIKDNKLDSLLSTIGVENYTTKRILSDGEKYKITIYDTAGQEKYRSLSLNSIRHCEGVILMYDITNRESFNSISEWIKNIYEMQNKDFPLILIGNKLDLKNQREISEEEGTKEAEKYKTEYFETSAIEGINVEKPFDELLNKIISKNRLKKNKTIHLDIKNTKRKTKHTCCRK